MRIDVQADDGDEISISADAVSVEQALVTIEIQNPLYAECDFESLQLTVGQARELAAALLSVADAIDYVRTPIISHNLARSGHLMAQRSQL